MKLECNITEKDFKKIMLKKRAKTNTIYLTIFSIIFIIVCFGFIINNLLLMSIVYLISLLIMWSLLYLINVIFTNIQFNIINGKNKEYYGSFLVEATNDSLVETGTNESFKINYKDVIYSKFKKDYFMIVDKGTSLMLRKSFFKNEEDFLKLSTFVEEKVKVK